MDHHVHTGFETEGFQVCDEAGFGDEVFGSGQTDISEFLVGFEKVGHLFGGDLFVVFYREGLCNVVKGSLAVCPEERPGGKAR